MKWLRHLFSKNSPVTTGSDEAQNTSISRSASVSTRQDSRLPTSQTEGKNVDSKTSSGSRSPASAGTCSPAMVQGALKLIMDHLERITIETRSGTHLPTLTVLEEIRAKYTEHVVPIVMMITQTLSDRKLHTKFIGGGGARTFLLVSVVPSDRFNSAHFFAREYPPGYPGYMDYWLRTEPLQIARQMGQDVFAHVIVYADASSHEPLSLGVGIIPLDAAKAESNPKAIMPIDSLTHEEKAIMGL